MTANLDAEDRALDVRVGENVRLRRKLLGMTQGGLADHLGLTFQQVQKYERGVNRIAASTLWRVAGALNCEVGDIFEGAAPPAVAKIAAGGETLTPGDVATAFLGADGGLELAGLWGRLAKDRRRAVLAVAKALARVD